MALASRVSTSAVAGRAQLHRPTHTRRAVVSAALRANGRGFSLAPLRKEISSTASSPSFICRVKSQSADLEIGMAAPAFQLKDVTSGKTVSISDFKGSPTLVMFLCVHCPYVVLLKENIVQLAKEYQAKGVKVVAISSNSTATHPQDGPEKMAEDAAKYGFTFPYLFDEAQEVAKAYTAACTPEFYVFTADHKLAYHGQYDDARPKMANSPPVTGKDLRAALDAVLAGKPAPKTRPSIGCNIKWAPGNEPSYFGAQVVKA